MGNHIKHGSWLQVTSGTFHVIDVKKTRKNVFWIDSVDAPLLDLWRWGACLDLLMPCGCVMGASVINT